MYNSCFLTNLQIMDFFPVCQPHRFFPDFYLQCSIIKKIESWLLIVFNQREAGQIWGGGRCHDISSISFLFKQHFLEVTEQVHNYSSLWMSPLPHLHPGSVSIFLSFYWKWQWLPTDASLHAPSPLMSPSTSGRLMCAYGLQFPWLQILPQCLSSGHWLEVNEYSVRKNCAPEHQHPCPCWHLSKLVTLLAWSTLVDSVSCQIPEYHRGFPFIFLSFCYFK